VATQHFFESMQWQAIHIFDRQQHRQNAGAGHAFFNQLSRLVRGDWRGFAFAATVDLAHMLDHSDLQWHDLELIAYFLANAVYTATAGAGQFVLGQFVDNFDARKIGGQRLALTALFGWRYDLFFHRFVDRLATLSASLNKAICGVGGSTVCSDLRPKRR